MKIYIKNYEGLVIITRTPKTILVALPTKSNNISMHDIKVGRNLELNIKWKPRLANFCSNIGIKLGINKKKNRVHLIKFNLIIKQRNLIVSRAEKIDPKVEKTKKGRIMLLSNSKKQKMPSDSQIFCFRGISKLI